MAFLCSSKSLSELNFMPTASRSSLDRANRESPEAEQTYLCHETIDVHPPLLRFSSNMLLLVWSLLEMHNFGLLSNFMNPWGSCRHADSAWVGPGCGRRFLVSSLLPGDAGALGPSRWDQQPLSVSRQTADRPLGTGQRFSVFFNVSNTY